MNKDIYVLGIETSCDETSASITKNGRVILSNIISSQIDIHKKFGGVVPEIASRAHIELISNVVDKAIKETNLTFKEIDVIGATCGPGLIGSLLVGLSYGKSLSYSIKKPFVGINHIESHIYANFLEHKNLEPPFIALVVSGGHTNLLYIHNYCKYELLGKTRDDAAGEVYDKIARALNLEYPGGPKLDNLAKKGKCNINFPKIMLEKDSLDFSFSGIKSAVLNYINICKMNKKDIIKEDIAASFQKSIVDVLCEKTIKACKLKNTDKIVLAGGVACNTSLRKVFTELAYKHNFKFFVPKEILCTDNAAMVSSCGYYKFINNKIDHLNLKALPNLSLFS